MDCSSWHALTSISRMEIYEKKTIYSKYFLISNNANDNGNNIWKIILFSHNCGLRNISFIHLSRWILMWFNYAMTI